jgi:hypothetical protein
VPEYLYEKGRIDTNLPFEQLRERAHINERARAAGPTAPDFSQQIRAGLPGIAAATPAAHQLTE